MGISPGFLPDALCCSFRPAGLIGYVFDSQFASQFQPRLIACRAQGDRAMQIRS
jgi:hypothetical protein